jgi:hypothetical protein
MKRHEDGAVLMLFWVLGDSEGFEAHAKKVVLHSVWKFGVLLLFPGSGVPEIAGNCPARDFVWVVLIETRKHNQTRDDTITNLFGLCDAYISELAATKTCEICRATMCTALNLGSFIQGLRELNMWPENRLEEYKRTKSVVDLVDQLCKIHIHEKPSIGFTGACPGKLGRDFKKQVVKIRGDASPLLEFHRTKLKETNDKLRLFP